MMKVYFLKILLFCIVGLTAISAIGQDEILFLNGKILKGSLLEKTKYEFTFKDLNGNQMAIDKYRVFSFRQNNKETVVYEFDTLSGNFLQVEEMKKFVFGERDAYATFKPKFANYMALGVGAGTGFMMQKNSEFAFIPIPLVFTAITLVFPTKVNQKKITDLKYLKEDEYLRGYERVARSKRTQGVLKNSLIGMGAGFLVGLIVNGNSDDN
jgi:hypothetical protein